MNKLVLVALVCPMLTLSACSPADPAPRSILVGNYRPSPVDQPQVQAARAFVQQKLPNLTLLDVTEAYTQVVAGINVKFVSTVSDDEGTTNWEFVAYQSLDGKWHLTSANRL